jgi:predicted RNA-binding protein YlqC (UPF0109 family)
MMVESRSVERVIGRNGKMISERELLRSPGLLHLA